MPAEVSFTHYEELPVLAFLQTSELRVPEVTELVCRRQMVSAQVSRACTCSRPHWTVAKEAVELLEAPGKGS